jgi:GH25 family lysozyme M1 (1,4-beta-N-acetylmuramidase)
MSQLHLPDVSEFQPDVNWAEVVAKNGGAAIIRALYGTSHVDKLWIQGRREAAHKAGVKVLGIDTI